MVRRPVNEITVVTDEEDRPAEIFQRALQRRTGPQIKMVRRLIQNKDIGIFGGQFGERRTASLSPAQTPDILELLILCQTECPQEFAAGKFFKDLSGGPNRVNHRNRVIEHMQMLIEVADLHPLPEPGEPTVRLEFPDETFQECRLPAAIRTDDCPAFSLLDIKRHVFKERSGTEPLGQIFHPKYNIAGPARFRERERGSLNIPGQFRGMRFEMFEFFPTVFGLSRFHPVMMTADKVFRLFDFIDILFIGSGLNQKTFLFESQILREISGIVVDCTEIEFKSTVRHPIEKIAVVADQDHRCRCRSEEIFKPFRRAQIEMVRRFIEKHDIRFS